jgi:hypothetical protein
MPTAKTVAVAEAEGSVEESTFPVRGRVFTNTRFPEVSILGPDGNWMKFNSSKFVAKDEGTAALLTGKRGIFVEPDEFLDLPVDDEKFYVHKATGFKTLNRDAYEDWINRSEWSATAAR